MAHRGAHLSALVILSVITSLTTIPLTGQSGSTRDTKAAKEAERQLILGVAEDLRKRDAAMALPTDARNWKPGRTPWGDTDLAGVYSNSDESGIPFERPTDLAGRRLEDITPAELEKLRQTRRDAIVDRAASAVEDPEGHPQLFWWETLNATNSRAWLVVDPADGRIPPTTPEAQKRAAARNEARRRSGRGPADGPEDRSLYDRCISRGVTGSMQPHI
jgi:type II secretory pathway pseudopilin PulG